MRNKQTNNMRLLPLEQLAPLNTFASKIFEDTDDATQEVCNFVLVLAIVFNDLKDLNWALHHLDLGKPSENEIVTPYRGEHGGFRIHLIKLILSTLHELIALLKTKGSILEHDLMVKLIKKISKKDREHWQRLLALADDKTLTSDMDNRLKRILLMTRHNVAFHYQNLKCFGKSYKDRFINPNLSIKYPDPYFSEGSNLLETRFYFADASVETFIEGLEQVGNKMAMAEEISNFAQETGRTLCGLVIRFIYLRNGAHRKVANIYKAK